MNCLHSRTRRRILLVPVVTAVTAITAVTAVCGPVARWAPAADPALTQPPAGGPATAPQATLAPLVVPATIEAFEQADLYPRASGYVSAVSADIGDHVKAGQVLATIDAPELEQEVAEVKAAAVAKRRAVDAATAAVRQAQQALAVAGQQVRRYEADLRLQEVTLKRQEELFAGKAITDQQLDDARARAEVARADAGVAAAKVAAAEADVEGAKAAREVAAAQADVADAEVAKTEALFRYTKLAAPFDGVVSRRLVNRGDLAQATMGPRSTPLFTVQRVDTVRVFCDVPEGGAWRVAPGTPATIKLFGRAATLSGTVTRTAASLNPEARTLRAEIDLPNAKEALLPGSYAQVTLTPEAAPRVAEAAPQK
jgi:multidrug resistance efflux pump